MNVGPTPGGNSAFQGFGVGNDRQTDRPSAVIARKEEKAEPFRRDDEKTRPAAVEAQSSKRNEGKNRGAKVDFSV
jgi:hypothetical protein